MGCTGMGRWEWAGGIRFSRDWIGVALVLVLTAGLLGLAAGAVRAQGPAPVKLPEIKGEEQAMLTAAPQVPPPITRKFATKVVVNLETHEVVRRLADGVEYTFWTFGGAVPGRFT